MHILTLSWPLLNMKDILGPILVPRTVDIKNILRAKVILKSNGLMVGRIRRSLSFSSRGKEIIERIEDIIDEYDPLVF